MHRFSQWGEVVLIITLVIAASIVIIDQLIKYFVVLYLPNAGTVEAIPYILDLNYVENRGVAFGMFKDMRWVFVTITVLIIAFLIYLICTKKETSKLFVISSGLVIGGGIGNVIDRIYYGFVVDYLQLSFFSPVCNFADYCITVGTVMLAIYLIFFSESFKKGK